MSNHLRAICRPQPLLLYTHTYRCISQSIAADSSSRVSIPNFKSRLSSQSLCSTCFDSLQAPKIEPWIRSNHHHRRTLTRAASNWTHGSSPYQILELEGDADEENIKLSYRRLAKFYHPDVYDGRGTLEEGESAETRFIKIQAAYELLMDKEQRRQYDKDNRVNPLKASQAWMDWLIKKRKAFDQRGDMAIAAWAEQQQREMNLRVRRLSRSKIDPDEERKILAKEKKASLENYNNTLRRHTLVLRKRDLMRKKAEEEKKRVISKLLAAEGLELENDDEEL